MVIHTFRKRKAEAEANEEEAKKKEVEWKKNFEVRIVLPASMFYVQEAGGGQQITHQIFLELLDLIC